MKKKLWLGVMVFGMLFGLTACSEAKEEPMGQGKNVSVEFINQTGEDVGILRVRPDEEYDWSENLLQEEVWKQNYKMPVSLSGELPKAEDGWQVEMKFLDGTEDIWQGVVLEDNTTAVFSYENELPVIKIEEGGNDDSQTSEEGNVTE
ncbi:hypothetical protein [Anaerotignum sp.]|uniref:hypothetical protein n=1 Tax=Anaerotignum sp. TaxID=2039241 RepID=UPI0027152071|nr:hypothetical protein [Anaerotignum sp.]